MGDHPQVFKSGMAALRFLNDQGYKVSKSKLYKDKGSLLPQNADGSINAADLLTYAAGLDKAESRQNPDAARLTVAKQAAEIKKLRESTNTIIFDREVKQGKYILKEEADRQKVDMVSVLEANFRHFFHARMPQICTVLSGAPEKINTAIDATNTWLDELFNQMAASAFQVTYEDYDDDDNEENEGSDNQ